MNVSFTKMLFIGSMLIPLVFNLTCKLAVVTRYKNSDLMKHFSTTF